jgi:hypothetical protein
VQPTQVAVHSSITAEDDGGICTIKGAIIQSAVDFELNVVQPKRFQIPLAHSWSGNCQCPHAGDLSTEAGLHIRLKSENLGLSIPQRRGS